MSAPVDLVLGRLDKVRAKRPGQWVARCPAHDDKHPSLAISEAPDGAVLLKCWSGCHTAIVLDRIGLEFSDLYPRDPGHSPRRPRLGPKALTFERLIYQAGKAQLARYEALTDADRARFFLAAQRLHDAGELTQ